MTLSEKIEKILEQVLMKHHDDISSSDDNAIAEARDAILEAVKEELPLVKGKQGCVGFIEDDSEYNKAIQEMRERIR